MQRSSEKAQRLRLRFARGPEAGKSGHLDLARIWERALADADIAVSCSQGSRPRARLTIAAGLPVGVTSDGELLDVVLAQRLDPEGVAERVRPLLPPGLDAREAWEVGMALPSLPSALRWADYDVDVRGEGDPSELAASVQSFLREESHPWEDTRGEKVRHYDLRALVQTIRLEHQSGGSARLSMRLRCGSVGVGRADQVVKALGLPEAVRIHRRCLVLSEASPARAAWRRVGRLTQ